MNPSPDDLRNNARVETAPPIIHKIRLLHKDIYTIGQKLSKRASMFGLTLSDLFQLNLTLR